MNERPYKLQVLRNIDDLRLWTDKWAELATRCGASSFFSHHVFARWSWERHRQDARSQLHVIIVEREGGLQLVMPLVKKPNWSGLSTLRWLDSGTPLYSDLLVAPEADFKVLTAIVRAHLTSVPLVLFLKVGFVREGSSLARLMEALGARRKSSTTSYGLDLKKYSGWDDFFDGRSSTSRQAYRRLFRRLGDHGGVEIQQISDPNQLEEEISWIFAMKRKWVLQRLGKPNWLSPPETEAWFGSTAIELSADKQAFVLRLSCNHSRIAAVLVYCCRTTLFASKIAYDPLWAKYSPGWLLNLKLISLAFEQGFDYIDFMMGEDSWKTRLMNEVCDIHRYRLPLRLGLFPATDSNC